MPISHKDNEKSFHHILTAEEITRGAFTFCIQVDDDIRNDVSNYFSRYKSLDLVMYNWSQRKEQNGPKKICTWLLCRYIDTIGSFAIIKAICIYMAPSKSCPSIKIILVYRNAKSFNKEFELLQIIADLRAFFCGAESSMKR